MTAGRVDTVMDARAIAWALERMAGEVVELTAQVEDLILIGIQRRGVELAERLATLISTNTYEVPRGALRGVGRRL